VTRFVALLRGINVGRAHQVDMPRLRKLLTERGHEDVRTHLRSGNVVLDSPMTETELAADLTAAITAEFGFDVPVVVRTGKELATVVAGDPFATVATDPARYLVTFMAEPPEPARVVIHLEGDAGVVAEAGRLAFGQRELAQAAAVDDADVGGVVEFAVAEGFEAVAPSGHEQGLLAEAWREVLRGGEVRLAGGLVEEEHPAGAEAEQLGHLLEGLREQRREIHRGVEGPRHVVEDGQLVAVPLKRLAILLSIVHRKRKSTTGAPLSRPETRRALSLP